MAAVRAFVVVERDIGVSGMEADGRLPYRLLTPWAGLIDKQGKGHGEFLSRSAN